MLIKSKDYDGMIYKLDGGIINSYTFFLEISHLEHTEESKWEKYYQYLF
jgi:hypothetical protein